MAESIVTSPRGGHSDKSKRSSTSASKRKFDCVSTSKNTKLVKIPTLQADDPLITSGVSTRSSPLSKKAESYDPLIASGVSTRSSQLSKKAEPGSDIMTILRSIQAGQVKQKQDFDALKMHVDNVLEVDQGHGYDSNYYDYGHSTYAMAVTMMKQIKSTSLVQIRLKKGLII
ncbi:hypothetical protein SNE40_014337 [Patella caerulea]|uniref:Uncharacterized protein n=1 Tax=Patella caerulea TaxID=87958 RepID=A0AAN8PSV6_PATCE